MRWMDFMSHVLQIMLLSMLGVNSVGRLYVLCDVAERAVCPLPAPCYRWATLSQCDFGTEIQPDDTPSAISACHYWFRGYKYYAYQFDLVQNDHQSLEDTNLDVIAWSRCTKRSFGVAPENSDAVAVLRSPIIRPTSCTVWRVTFWYRLSDYPVIDSANPQNQFHLKVFVENHGQSFPTEMIWGREEDYDSFLPNTWYLGEAVFHRDHSEPFVLYWFAYHNDNCEVDLKPIAVDTIRIQYAIPAVEGSGVCPVVTISPIAVVTTPATTTTTTSSAITTTGSAATVTTNQPPSTTTESSTSTTPLNISTTTNTTTATRNPNTEVDSTSTTTPRTSATTLRTTAAIITTSRTTTVFPSPNSTTTTTTNFFTSAETSTETSDVNSGSVYPHSVSRAHYLPVLFLLFAIILQA
ncbi:uncharacterized protein LOC129581754 [Paramacrobiotus metropolitanus]|uniref:uncharacterized protein LOC129581754 n=1 Tax=Paramacrobiotus metropolitanus TaxID=2943436 RepID=UPI002445F73C|nr:uncharacterized protein LOC129581754 [Paramacrobiotus metropolitanus]